MPKGLDLRYSLKVVAALGIVLLSACGGGGGDGGSTQLTPAPNSPPSVNAGTDQTVQRNVTVTLSGSATDNGGAAGLSYSWTQSAGTTVTLTGADQATATFTSPDIAQDETLTFTLTVTDSEGASGSDDVSVQVIADVAPTVDAGADQSVQQNETVTLTGTATDDDDVANLTFAWTQIAGTAVTLANADSASATFTAPMTTGVQTLEFRVTVTDAGGQQDNDEVSITVFEDINSSTISGKAEYQFVPFGNGGLNYTQQRLQPIRGATIQLIDATTQAVLESAVLDEQGNYLFAAPANTNVFLRIRAELKRAGTPGWDVEVRDNTATAGGAALADRALYVLDGTPFDSGVGSLTVDLQALSGWTGASYGNTRAAAPFAILDTIYNAIQMVVAADPNAVFAPLDSFWSVNNSPTIATNRNFDTGELGTSFYRGDIDSLFLLGEENSDTEEFDTHVVAHEWGHYFEDNFSRSDSTGGAHTLSDRLDPRLAFGEGFGNAVSAMINGNAIYFDTQGTQQGSGFSFSVESNRANAAQRGWYNEGSVQVILYDLFDSNDDVGDSISLGFKPIYDVLVNEQRVGTPFTTIFPFITAIRARNPSLIPEIDALLATQRIVGANDAFGTNEIEAAGRNDVVLPIYTELAPGAAPVNLCSTNVFDGDEDGNKLSVRRFLRISVATAGDYQFNIVTTNPPAVGISDPDAFVFREGVLVGFGGSGVANSETFTLTGLTPGDYVMVLYEFSYLRGDPVAITQPDSRTCFDVSMTL